MTVPNPGVKFGKPPPQFDELSARKLFDVALEGFDSAHVNVQKSKLGLYARDFSDREAAAWLRRVLPYAGCD